MKTNAILINTELFHAEGTIHQIIELAKKGIIEVKEVGDFVRIVFSSTEDASTAQKLIADISKSAPDEVMLAIA
jgi:hypothetical protein